MRSRIIEFLKVENKTSAQLAEEIGVQPSGISHILSGRNKPSLDFVLKMLEKYTFLSTDWLLFGKGDMYNEMKSIYTPQSPPNLDDFKKEVEKNMDKASGQSKNILDSKDIEFQQKRGNSLTVQKIIWFYNDGTFREFVPSGE